MFNFETIITRIMDRKTKEKTPDGENRPAGGPETVFAAKGTFPGEINLQWDAVEGATSYILQVAKGAKGKWVQVDIVTDPFYMLSGLSDKSEHSFRVAAVFPDGQGEWSKVSSKKLDRVSK